MNENYYMKHLDLKENLHVHVWILIVFLYQYLLY